MIFNEDLSFLTPFKITWPSLKMITYFLKIAYKTKFRV